MEEIVFVFASSQDALISSNNTNNYSNQQIVGNKAKGTYVCVSGG